MSRGGGYRQSQLAVIRNGAEDWFVGSRLKALSGDTGQWIEVWVGLIKDPRAGL